MSTSLIFLVLVAISFIIANIIFKISVLIAEIKKMMQSKPEINTKSGEERTVTADDVICGSKIAEKASAILDNKVQG